MYNPTPSYTMIEEHQRRVRMDLSRAPAMATPSDGCGRLAEMEHKRRVGSAFPTRSNLILRCVGAIPRGDCPPPRGFTNGQ